MTSFREQLQVVKDMPQRVVIDLQKATEKELVEEIVSLRHYVAHLHIVASKNQELIKDLVSLVESLEISLNEMRNKGERLGYWDSGGVWHDGPEPLSGVDEHINLSAKSVVHDNPTN